jgi:hypothetical protein
MRCGTQAPGASDEIAFGEWLLRPNPSCWYRNARPFSAPRLTAATLQIKRRSISESLIGSPVFSPRDPKHGWLRPKKFHRDPPPLRLSTRWRSWLRESSCFLRCENRSVPDASPEAMPPNHEARENTGDAPWTRGSTYNVRSSQLSSLAGARGTGPSNRARPEADVVAAVGGSAMRLRSKLTRWSS